MTTDEAIARLEVIPDYDPGNGPQPCVHTFADAGIALLGAHWALDDVRRLIEDHGVEETGPAASATNHGLAVPRPDQGPLFLETKPDA